MNKTENKTQAQAQADFSNIRELQNIVKSNGISKLSMALKSFKQRLSLVSAKITESKKKSEETKKVETKPVEPKVKEPVESKEPKITMQSALEKPAESKPVTQTKQFAQGVQRSNDANRQTRQGAPAGNGYQARQNGLGQRPNGGSYQGRDGAQNRQGQSTR